MISKTMRQENQKVSRQIYHIDNDSVIFNQIANLWYDIMAHQKYNIKYDSIFLQKYTFSPTRDIKFHIYINSH